MKKRSDHLTIRQVRLIHYNRVLDAESCFQIGLSHLAANYFTRLNRRAWQVNGAQPFRGVLRVESLNAKSICCEVRAGFMVHILTDTTACLSIEYACQHHIPVIPQIVTFEDESFYYFLVDTLEYLARGGRIGGASALVGSLLQVKPILTLQDGEVAPYEKQRTHRRAVLRLVEIVQEQYPASRDGCLVVMHADVTREAAQLTENLAACLQLLEIPVVDLPPAISVHGGPGTLAVSFFTG